MKSVHELGELRVAVECCICAEDKVLVQRRSADSKFFPNYLTFPGGHVDQGEDIVTAAARELYEETGVKLDKEKLSLRLNALNHHTDKNQVWLINGFIANIDNAIELKSTEEGEVFWMDIQEFETSGLVFPPIKYYLDHLFNSDKILFMSASCEGGFVKNVTSEVLI